MEGYRGVKFKSEFLSNQLLADSRLKDIIKWCGILHKLTLTPPYKGGSYGNLSFRWRKGKDQFIITCSATDFGSPLTISDFSRVEKCDFENRVVYYHGEKERSPSSECMVHYAIYKKRPDVGAVFHGHGFNGAVGLGFPMTEREEPYGTIELVESVLEILGENNFLIMKNHGFLSLGRTINDAGKRVSELYEQFQVS